MARQKPLMNSSQAKRARLLDLLPEYDWSIAKAGVAAGYSATYATTTLARTIKGDASFCQAMLDRRRAIEAGTQDRRNKRLANLDSIIDDPDVSTRDRIRAIEVQGKMCGWLETTLKLETPDRERQLSEAQRRLSRAAADLLLDTRRLPDGSAAPIIDAESASTGISTIADNKDTDGSESCEAMSQAAASGDMVQDNTPASGVPASVVTVSASAGAQMDAPDITRAHDGPARPDGPDGQGITRSRAEKSKRQGSHGRGHVPPTEDR